MSNLPAVQSKAERFVVEILPPERMDSIISTLPAHVKPERFQRNVSIAISQHPKLLECDPAAVFNEIVKAAALGLYLDPQLGEAYLITGWDSRNKRPAPQLRLGYRGLIKLARQSGTVLNVYAHEVCQNDYLELSLGTEKRLVHKPDYTKERGPVVLYYAVVEFADGTKDFEPMPIKEIERIRDRSDGWKAFKENKIKSTPWGTDFNEMAKKTCLRRLLKRLPQSPEIGDALRIEDEDYAEYQEVPQRPSLADRLSAQKMIPATEGFSVEHVNRETGEIIDTDPEPSEERTQISDSEDMTPSEERKAAASPNDAAETGDVDTPSTTPVSEENKKLLNDYYLILKRANKKESVQGYVIQFWRANPGIRENLPEDVLKRFAAIKLIRISTIEDKIAIEEADKQVKEVIG